MERGEERRGVGVSWRWWGSEGGVKAERIADARAKVKDPTEERVALATLSPVHEFMEPSVRLLF